MSRIAILGGTGFVGSHLISRLERHGHRSVVLSRNTGIACPAKVLPNVEFRTTDIYAVKSLAQRLHDCDTVINLVGIGNENRRGDHNFQRTHVQLVESILSACHATGIQRLIHISALNAGSSESRYLHTKGQAESLVKDSGLHWTLVRPSVIFGPGDRFLNRFAALLQFLPVFPLACPQARLQPVFIDDVTAAIASAIERPIANDCLELGGPKRYALIDLVRYVATLTKRKRLIYGLPVSLSWLQAIACEFLPGKPFSRDNFRSLQLGSVTDNNALTQLGIQPTALETVAPNYLGDGARAYRYQRYRRAAGRTNSQ